MKQSVAKFVSDGFLFTLETLVLEQFLPQSRTALLLKVERPVVDRLLKRAGSGLGLNTFTGVEITTEPKN